MVTNLVKITGKDFFVNTEGNAGDVNISSQSYLTPIDDKIIPALAKFSQEDWHAKSQDSDLYDPNSLLMQTIALQSTAGSTLLFKQDGGTYYTAIESGFQNKQKWSNNCNFNDSLNTVKFSSTNSYDMKHDSITGAGGNDIYEAFSYSNLGDDGKNDDVIASRSHSSHGVYTHSNGKTAEKATFIDATNYSSAGYNFVTSAKTVRNESGTYVISGNDTSSSYQGTEITSISQYKFSNLSDSFLFSVTGSMEYKYGSVSSMKLSLAGVNLATADYSLTAAKVTYVDEGVAYVNEYSPNEIMVGLCNIQDNLSNYMFPIDKMQTDIMNRVVPNIMKGDNNIKIKNTDGFELNAGEGKDTVVGGIGNDTITGGAGSDKLTGGKGTDTFVFSQMDFFSFNSNEDLVYNKSVDVITDFNLKEHDNLDFGDLGELSFYTSINAAKQDNAHLFYVKGTGNIYLNTSSTDGFTPTVIITLTGKAAVNAEMTDFNYPII